jgi:hypothetical protein
VEAWSSRAGRWVLHTGHIFSHHIPGKSALCCSASSTSQRTSRAFSTKGALFGRSAAQPHARFPSSIQQQESDCQVADDDDQDPLAAVQRAASFCCCPSGGCHHDDTRSLRHSVPLAKSCRVLEEAKYERADHVALPSPHTPVCWLRPLACARRGFWFWLWSWSWSWVAASCHSYKAPTTPLFTLTTAKTHHLPKCARTPFAHYCTCTQLAPNHEGENARRHLRA